MEIHEHEETAVWYEDSVL